MAEEPGADVLFLSEGLAISEGSASSGGNAVMYGPNIARGESNAKADADALMVRDGVAQAGPGFTIATVADALAGDTIVWFEDDNGDPIEFPAGKYEITVEGGGYTHWDRNNEREYFCNQEDPGVVAGDEPWIHSPCCRVVDPNRSVDGSRSVYYDIDDDGEDEQIMGLALIYPGAPNYNEHLERDAVGQTRIFTDKDLSDPSSSTGKGTIELDESGRIGVYNLDEPGSYGDNSVDGVNYELRGPN